MPSLKRLTSLQGLWRNLGWKTLSELSSRALGLIFFFVLARSLGEQAFGQYSLPLAIAGLLAIVLDPGCHSLMIRDLAREPELEALHLRHLLAIRLGCSLGFFMLLLLAWPFFASQLSLFSLLAGGCVLFGQSWMDTQVAWLNAHQAFALEARLRFWLKLLVMIPPLLALAFKPDVESILWASALPHLICLPWFYWQIKDRLQLKQGLELPRLKHYLAQGAGFWLAGISWILYLKLDLVMLPMLGRSSQELGWYQVAVRCYEILSLGGYLLSMTVFPRLSALAHQAEQREFWQQARHLTKLSAGLGLGAALSGLLLAPLLPWILGAGFEGARQALLWLSLGLPFVYLNFLAFNLLGSLGKQHLSAWATTLCLLCNAALNIFAIPYAGFVGAALSTLASDALLCLLLLAQLYLLQPGRRQAKS